MFCLRAPTLGGAGVVFGFAVENKTCWELLIYLFLRHVIG